MAEEWLTYSELGERLGVSSEAARQKAMRLRLRKQPGNDGKVRVWVDWEEVAASTTARRLKDEENDEPTADEQPWDERTIAALEAHIESLREAVKRGETAFHAERARADQERDRADTERSRVDELLRQVAELAAETGQRADNDRRTAEELAHLRKELAAHKSRPWWKRLAS